MIERSFYVMAMPTDPDYLAQLQDYYARHGVLPSYARIGELVGLRSKSSVSALVGRLSQAGYLQHTPGRRLAPTEAFFSRAVVDTVRAGQPQAANDPGLDGLAIDSYLVQKPSRTVLMKVKGDSMIDAGLQEGDHLVIDRGGVAKAGDIVVAIVDNQFTVKYLAQDTRGFYLKPGNIAYPVIRPQGQLDIYGVVTGSFRRYGG
jgi:repressor LexA